MRLALVIIAILAVAAATMFVPRPHVPDAAEVELRRAIGSVLMVGFDGDEPSGSGVRRTAEQIERGEIAGVMFLRRNVRDEANVKALNAGFREAGGARPPLVALDQEGGRVVRLGWRVGFRRVPSARNVAAGMTPERARDLYAALAEDLFDWGFNVNFGPVVDLDVNPDNPIIGRLGRSFGADAATVTAYARAFLKAHEAAGVITALKHFPGHGSSRGDSHLGRVDVTETWTPEELRPYRTLIAEGGVRMVMTGHIVNRQMGADRPATLSASAIDVLRKTLGFDGVVVSDDLQMDAVANLHGEEEAAELALRAGIDLLLFANDGLVDPDLVARVTDHLVAKGQSDDALNARILEAADRISALRSTRHLRSS